VPRLALAITAAAATRVAAAMLVTRARYPTRFSRWAIRASAHVALTSQPTTARSITHAPMANASFIQVFDALLAQQDR